MKNLKIIVFILVVSVSLLIIFLPKNETIAKTTKTTVLVSTFALYDIAKSIVSNESIDIVNILPFGTDPHSFELTPKLMTKIEKSTLLFYSGVGLEPWIHQLKIKNSVNVSDYVELREIHNDEFEHHEHHDEQCAHGTLDPHYWLDFNNMKNMTMLISRKLVELSPTNRVLFEKNRDKYINMLDMLHKTYTKQLASCKLDTIVLNHNSVGYLASNYKFHADSLSGLSPEAQATASDITRILHEIKKDSVSTIFFENFADSNVIKSIAKDENIEVDVIQPLGNITAKEAQEKLSYEDIMYINLKKLSKALQCN